MTDEFELEFSSSSQAMKIPSQAELKPSWNFFDLHSLRLFYLTRKSIILMKLKYSIQKKLKME